MSWKIQFLIVLRMFCRTLICDVTLCIYTCGIIIHVVLRNWTSGKLSIMWACAEAAFLHLIVLRKLKVCTRLHFYCKDTPEQLKFGYSACASCWIFLDVFCRFANEAQIYQYRALRRHCNSAEASARSGAYGDRAWMPSGVGKHLVQAIQNFGFVAVLDISIQLPTSPEQKWGLHSILIICKAPMQKSSFCSRPAISACVYAACDLCLRLIKQYMPGLHYAILS